MKIVTFENIESFNAAAAGLIEEHFVAVADGPHAVMLTGGNTPTGVYDRLAREPVRADSDLWILQSDERHVPLDSVENNYAKTMAMLAAVGVDDARVMRVHTELGLREAADRYDRELASFFVAGGRITLGILGLGADGHAASLFSSEDVEMGEGRYAIAVPREGGPDRVSVTRDLLRRVERLVFIVAGKEKEEIVHAVAERREGITALRAVEGCGNVELWFSG